MVRSALGLGNDVVHGHVAKLEMVLASMAVAALLAIQKPLVPLIVVADDLAEIGTFCVRPVPLPRTRRYTSRY